MSDWFNLLKVAGSVSFGGHGANPLLSSDPPAIMDDEEEVDRINIYQEIEKDGEEN
ncbi:MAG: hypothetical protein GOVbin1753_12 [Prokaryotic dsDNA virus sp.]|nr:MAG: hypothetical protein GOVbin1753_12 [Prokaryotic dsDNA virus sp.]|tara:strand:+ start:7264 stop:7431 length:168 start_codon:yes stop_codon:yes gene_type:complete